MRNITYYEVCDNSRSAVRAVNKMVTAGCVVGRVLMRNG
jgi:hypothetical protein